jgi:4-alpha-glucanotransferase
MIANFHIQYGTKQGEQIAIQLFRNGVEEIIVCQSYDSTNWIGTIELSATDNIRYKYMVQSFRGLVAEHGLTRLLAIPKKASQIFLQDQWRAEYEVERAFFSAAFKDVIFKRSGLTQNLVPSKQKVIQNRISLQLYAASIPQDCIFGVMGSTPLLGDWASPLLMSDKNFPTWEVELFPTEQVLDFEYKFVIYNTKTKQIVSWESGENRIGQFSFIDHAPTLASPPLAASKPKTELLIPPQEASKPKTELLIPPQEASKPKTELLIMLPEGGSATSGNYDVANRSIIIIRTEEGYRYSGQLWRGAGVAIPVFSLRSEQGLGIGEYTDLKLLVDWSVKTGMKMVQILPVNDTLATMTWLDSYPYAAISVFALHPLYINIESIANLKDRKSIDRLNEAKKKLNALPQVDFDQVLAVKMAFFKELFQQEKLAFFKNEFALQFIESNADWLQPYAAFCHLRDLNGTTNFNQWSQYSSFSTQVIQDLCHPKYKKFEDIALYYFIQFHANQQLFGATEYARSKGIILKGDLPIGIYRYSCDAWTAPHLYNMDGQAGAPPDAYAVAGQNWGFPTYNWETMAVDNFAWWRQRMTKLSEYFDALRIDHILGFFRIWEIPTNQVEGTLGLFNPRLPYSRQELDTMGLRGNLERYTQPYIRGHYLAEIFGEDTPSVISEFLTEIVYNEFQLKEHVNTQEKIKEVFSKSEIRNPKSEIGLMGLVGEVLIIEEELGNSKGYNPRITVHTTRSYKELDDFGKHIIDILYTDYFFKRHDEFWKQQALWKLPALVRATNMLICGEDLGMIPNSVPGVMRDLNVIALEIQRMPKGSTDFGDTKTYPYMSVCSPSCHDMSTVRGWWESDLLTSQKYYHQNLKGTGVAPAVCTTEMVEAINKQHLAAPSMWAVFPIQDLVGMDDKLRRTHAAEEQINEPSNPQHYWRFRFHLSLEQLLKEEFLNKRIKTMVEESNR